MEVKFRAFPLENVTSSNGSGLFYLEAATRSVL